MKKGSKECYELMEQFEKDYRHIAYSRNLERENSANVPKDIFYCNGETNTHFKAFMHGYAYAKFLIGSETAQ